MGEDQQLLTDPTNKQSILKLGKCFLQRLPLSIAKNLDRFNLNLLGIIFSNFANELMMDYADAYDRTEARNANVEAKGTGGADSARDDIPPPPLVNNLHIQTSIQSLQTKMDNLSIDVKQLGELCRYDVTNEHVIRPLANTSLSQLSHVVHRCLRRNAWTPFEIQQDYLVRLRERRDPELEDKVDYSGNGGCKFISSLAYDWFDRWHALNDPRHKQCLLVHETDKKGVQLSDNTYPDQNGAIEVNMMCYRWTEGCLWAPMDREFMYPNVGTPAVIHHVVRVTVAPSSFLLVDWSAGQFRDASLHGALLFCSMD